MGARSVRPLTDPVPEPLFRSLPSVAAGAVVLDLQPSVVEGLGRGRAGLFGQQSMDGKDRSDQTGEGDGDGDGDGDLDESAGSDSALCRGDGIGARSSGMG